MGSEGDGQGGGGGGGGAVMPSRSLERRREEKGVMKCQDNIRPGYLGNLCNPHNN